MRHGKYGMIDNMSDIFRAIIRQYHTWKPSIATKNILYHLLTREHMRSYGPLNVNTTFYVIRSIKDHSPFYIGPIHNLLANYFYVLSHLQYAKIKGYIPIIDQQNYPVYNSVPYPVNGTMNAWEYFWQQPCGVSLEEIYHSKLVVLSQQSWFGQWDMGYDVHKYTDKDIIAQFHHLSQWVPLNVQTAQYVQQVKDRLMPRGKKILGVSYRFVGHAKASHIHGEGHPIQPEIDELVLITKKCFEKWKMDRVFLASDEASVIDRFQSEFGQCLMFIPRLRCEAGHKYNAVNMNPMYLPENQYETALSYLTEMELLALCDTLLGSITSGLRYAMVRNGGVYENVEIIDQGIFLDKRKRHQMNIN